MNRTVRWVVAIAVLQAVLVGVYWRVEHQRALQTAESLGISVRTLRNKLNEYRQEGVDI